MASFLAKMGANARFQAKLRGGADNTAAHRQGATVILDQARCDGLDLMGYVMRSGAPRLKLH